MKQGLHNIAWIFPCISSLLFLKGMIDLMIAVHNVVYFAGLYANRYPLETRPEYYQMIQTSFMIIILGMIFLGVSLMLTKWMEKDRIPYDLLVLVASLFAPNLLLIGQNNYGFMILNLDSPLGSAAYSNYEPLTWKLNHVLDYWWPDAGSTYIQHTSQGITILLMILSLLSFLILFRFRMESIENKGDRRILAGVISFIVLSYLFFGLIISSVMLPLVVFTMMWSIILVVILFRFRIESINKEEFRKIIRLMVFSILSLYLFFELTIIISFLSTGIGSFPIFMPIPLLPMTGIYILYSSTIHTEK